MTKAALAKIHIAKKEMGLDDFSYREILKRVTGHSSSAKMNDNQRGDVVEEFKRMGWKPKQRAKGNNWRKQSDNPHHRKIWALGKELDKRGYWHSEWKEALRMFVKSETGVDDIDWLETKQASNVIEALKSIVRRS